MGTKRSHERSVGLGGADRRIDPTLDCFQQGSAPCLDLVQAGRERKHVGFPGSPHSGQLGFEFLGRVGYTEVIQEPPSEGLDVIDTDQVGRTATCGAMKVEYSGFAGRSDMVGVIRTSLGEGLDLPRGLGQPRRRGRRGAIPSTVRPYDDVRNVCQRSISPSPFSRFSRNRMCRRATSENSPRQSNQTALLLFTNRKFRRGGGP